MADVFTKAHRSQVMSRIRSSRNLSTELKLIKIFKDKHVKGWRRNYKIIGKPDFVFPQMKLAVFVDGCFWHGHACKNLRPKSNKEYWDKKFERNALRDQQVNAELKKRNWKVLRIWECELRTNKYVTKLTSYGLLR